MIEMMESSRSGAMRRRDGLCPKRVKNGESLSVLLLLAVRRVRREHTRRMSKDALNGGELEVLWTFHHCFIDILVVCFLNRCMNLITGRFCLSSAVSSIHRASHNRPVCCHFLPCFSSEGMHRLRKHDPEICPVSKNVPQSKCQFLAYEMGK
jgi:hypothetical protein